MRADQKSNKVARRRGRPKLYTEQLRVPLRAGTTERLDAVTADDEDRLDVIREAIEREIARRVMAFLPPG